MKQIHTQSLMARLLVLGISSCFSILAHGAEDGALSGHRHRVLISSDIGGTDPDDLQSMAHLFVYADCFDLEGLVSSPYGEGRKEHILKAIDAYEIDYGNLKTYSDSYPTPDSLRAICKQGALTLPDHTGVGQSTEGSQWIVQCARRKDPRPLHVLVWGGIDDVAQALHDDPGILPKLRVYWIGGPNKKWGVNAYNYVEQHHPKLWMIESNATYRGWFVGGNQKGEWDNSTFVSTHVAGHGALGKFFVDAKKSMKMGDTPSIARLTVGDSEDPAQPSWGGKYVRIWDGRKTVFDRHTTKDDKVEAFGVTEFELPVPDGFSSKNTASMIFSGGRPPSVGVIEGEVMRFRFSPRDAKVWSYEIKSDFPSLHGQSGKFDAVPPSKERTSNPSSTHPNWWIDDPDPATAEGVHPGAKSVNQWREDFLRDFAQRMDRTMVQVGTASPKSSITQPKPRILVLTDIENEPDDAQSLVRFLTYANQFDIEGLVATTSRHQRDKTAEWRIKEIVSAYGKVQKNLLLHEPGYPTADFLNSIIRKGRPDFGMNAVGEGNDSSGSELLIAAADRDDPRPLWVPVWGGPNVLAQALWKVKKTRSPEALAKFVAKLRVYTISDQDNSGPWIRKTFPDLFFVASPGIHPGGAYHFATWSGISGDRFHARFTGADFMIVSNYWLDKNIRQDHGPLGAEHPHTEFLMEGDTPSFLGLVINGLNSPENPNWGGWGGRYEFYTPRMQKHFQEPETRPFWTNAVDEVFGHDGNWHTSNHATIWRWRTAYQNDFAARIDWTTKPYDEANHPPVVKLAHSSKIKAKRGDVVQLSAEGTTDPDGDALSYEWFYYGEVGTFTTSSGTTGQPIAIKNFDQKEASFTVPEGRVMAPGTGTMHIILAVTDHGSPRLTRYGRVIVTVQ